MNSPAIDRGHSFGLTTDERGAPRPFDHSSISNAGDGSDIGAFELIPPVVSIAHLTDKVVLSWSIYSIGFTLQSVTNLDSNNWVPVGGTPVTIGSRLFLTNAILSGNGFFQLR